MPAALDDVESAWIWATSQEAAAAGFDTSRVAVYGSSAGSNLAAGLAIRLKNQGKKAPALTLLDSCVAVTAVHALAEEFPSDLAVSLLITQSPCRRPRRPIQLNAARRVHRALSRPSRPSLIPLPSRRITLTSPTLQIWKRSDAERVRHWLYGDRQDLSVEEAPLRSQDPVKDFGGLGPHCASRPPFYTHTLLHQSDSASCTPIVSLTSPAPPSQT